MRIPIHVKLTGAFLVITLAAWYCYIHMRAGLFLKISIVILIPALVFWIVCLLWISRPLKELSRAAQGIASGDLSRKFIFLSGDEIESLALSFNDMSDKVRVQLETLRAHRSRLEAVLLSMFDGIMVLDEKGEIVLINKAVMDLFSVTRDPTGKKPLEVVHNIEIQGIADNVLKLEEGVISGEISLLAPQERTVLVHATPVRSKKVIGGGILVFHDITGLRALENMRKDFVANVSHELRTPLSTIRGYAETLLDGAIYDKENNRDFLRIIHDDAQRLGKLIDDLLNLSRIESGKLKLDLKPVRIDKLFLHVLSGFKKRASDKSISITVEQKEATPLVLADENVTTQIMVNLVDNAVKYTSDGGEIVLKAVSEGRVLKISVTDNGIGIPESDLPRIFERFYRIDKGRSRELGGTGLGLSIVKHLVQSQNGDVTVVSSEGKGSSFTFTLPIV